MLENCLSLIPRQLENVFLLDWVTIVFHGVTEYDVKYFLRLKDVPWQTKTSFINGYPLDLFFDHIHIRHGADRPEFYDDPKKARTDMGVCLDMSGQGCREFESWSEISWFEFITDAFRCMGVPGATMSVTRLDLAYDDHCGLLNIWRIKSDVEDRNYISKSKKSRIIWSDDQETDIRGLTLEIGSRSSPVLIRIYDKAAERGYPKGKHWVRVELQLRKVRALEAFKLLFQRESIGLVASGIIRNYCMFVSPTNDTNRARWPIAEYWQRVLDGMEKLRVWHSPGEEYNFAQKETHLIHQFGQLLQVVAKLETGGIGTLLHKCSQAHPQLKPKYQAVLEKELLLRKIRNDEVAKLRDQFGFVPQEIIGAVQTDFAELLIQDPDCPW